MVDSSTPTTKPSSGRAQSDDAPESASLGDLVAELDAARSAPRPPRRKPAPAAAATDATAPAEDAPAARPAAQSSQIFLTSELPLGEEDDLSAVEGEAAPRLVSIVESLLFAATKPLGVRDLRGILKDASVRQIQLALKQLGRDLEGRGVVLAQAAGGFRLRTNPENGRWVQHLLAERPVKLSRSQLESLAVVAYRQPITKPEMDHIRGVDCAAVLKVLLDHDLVRIVGRKEEPGRPHLYGTTLKFLEFFNLRSLRDMPDLHEFRELTEESRAVVREQLGPSALYDEREAMGQEVLQWEGGDAPTGDDGDGSDTANREDADDGARAVDVGASADAEVSDEGADDEGSQDEAAEDEAAEDEAAEDEAPEDADEASDADDDDDDDDEPTDDDASVRAAADDEMDAGASDDDDADASSGDPESSGDDEPAPGADDEDR